MNINEIQRIRKVNRIKNFTLAIINIIKSRIQSVKPVKIVTERNTP